VTSDERQQVVDREHLRLLALFHYVSAGVTLAFASMLIVMVGIMSIAFATMPGNPAAPCTDRSLNPSCPPGAAQPPLGFILAFFGFFALIAITFGVLEIISGRCMAKQKRRVLSLIVAIPGLLFIPYGTMLSIFTLLVLERPSIKALYQESANKA